MKIKRNKGGKPRKKKRESRKIMGRKRSYEKSIGCIY